MVYPGTSGGGAMDYINRPFDGETIELDRNTYTNCTFKNCTMVYRGSMIIMWSSRIPS